MDALQDFPDFDTKLVTEKGDAVCQKQDIFKGLMWFAYTNNFANWQVLKIEQVREIVAQNKQKIKVSSLEDFAVEVPESIEKDFNNAMGQESLTRFDQPKKKKRPAKKRKPLAENVPAGSNKIVAAGVEVQNRPQKDKRPEGQNRPPRENRGEGQNKPPRENRPAGQKGPAIQKNGPIIPLDNKIIPVNRNEPKK
jgi:hypothetical protein